ncbi:MAG: hypothetical protein ABSC76_14495 [Terracidiphilus sp.]|jgi:hypothetical protein
MRISAFSEAASSSADWNSGQAKPASAAGSSSSAAQKTAPAPAAQSAASAGIAPSPAQIYNSAVGSQVSTVAASYSTTVAGRSYAASVEESGGTYTASVPIPPGLSASGSSIESAENNLNIILDTLA